MLSKGMKESFFLKIVTSIVDQMKSIWNARCLGTLGLPRTIYNQYQIQFQVDNPILLQWNHQIYSPTMNPSYSIREREVMFNLGQTDVL
jgi:hypothetical protein